MVSALRGLPEALGKLSKPKGLIDPRGLGKPQILGDNADEKFRLWAIKLEDYVSGVFGGKSREVLEWAAGMDAEITPAEIDASFGGSADILEQWDEVHEFNEQLYTVLRATTEGGPFDLVENCATGAGLDAWRSLHRRFDPATGSRKRVMLQALTNPERASYETLQGALERWKALRSRYDRKKDQFGSREALPESLAMNALEKLVPKELETHLMLNYARFKTFEEMEKEVVNFMEAKTGSRMIVSSNFSKPSGGSSGPVPMDVDSLVKVVSGNIVSIVKKGGKGDGKGNANKIKFDGNCDNCGKYGHRKRDCWSKPTGAGKGATSRSPTSSPKKEVKFAGTCNHCGKPGHKKAECWSAQGKGKGQKGGGGKGNNNKNSANALDLPEPEPRPGDANGLELCALEVCTLEEARERSSVRSESQRASTLRSESHRASTRTRSSRRRTESSAADRSASSVESSDSVEKPWLKCNLDTGTSVTVFPKDMFEAGEPNDMRLKTASGEVVKAYGKATVHGKDTRGLMRKLNGGGRRPQDPGERSEAPRERSHVVDWAWRRRDHPAEPPGEQSDDHGIPQSGG